MATRSQQQMVLAEARVTSVSHLDPKVQRIYGGLCHSFPVFVRTCGLGQAVAFSLAKSEAGDDAHRQQAHQLVLEDLSGVLEVTQAAARVRDADTLTYMHYTRQVLSAWIFFKRFAESVLKVRAGEEEAEARPGVTL